MKDLTVMYDFGRVSESFLLDFIKKYMELIQKYNGVQFIENCFNYIDADVDTGESSIGFCAYGDETGADGIYKFQDHDGLGYENVIVFGLNGSGDYISFDYRQNPEIDNPPVVIMYHDQFVKDQSGNFKMLIVKVAENFEDFLNMLHA